MSRLAEKMLTREGVWALERFTEDIRQLEKRPSDVACDLELNASDGCGVRTKMSEGEYERGSRKGGREVYAELSSKWRISPVGALGKKRPRPRFQLTDLASTEILVRDSNGERLLAWQMDIASPDGPGCYFHIQVDQGKDGARLPVPRFPSLMITPMAALDFVLGELFQDRWLQLTCRNDYSARLWRSIQQGRWKRLLEWHLHYVESTGRNLFAVDQHQGCETTSRPPRVNKVMQRTPLQTELVPHSCKVATPSPLAVAMVKTLGIRPGESWLDPCVGGGIFARSLHSEGVPTDRIFGLDLEPEPMVHDGLAQVTWGQDYLNWAQSTVDRFDNIIGNPPYLAISRLPDTLQRSALGVTAPGGGYVPRGANYWYAFLCASLRLLRRGGSLCFVLPSAWDYADYAMQARTVIPSLFRCFRVHRCHKPLFDSVLDGCLVIVGRGFRECPQEHSRFSYDSTDEFLKGVLEDRSSARSSLSVTQSETEKRRLRSSRHRQRPLGDLIDIRLGGVTGDARYFLLNESQRRKLNLPAESLQPVLTRARHLVASEMTTRLWHELRDAEERVWLFNPPDEYLDDPRVRSYLDLKEKEGGCRRERYKVKSRQPWYRIRLPEGVDGFLSGMTQHGPWLCFSYMPRLAATNTLYTFRFKDSLSDDEKAGWALALRNAYQVKQNNILARKYADGLVKYEPGDLYKILLDPPKDINGARASYKQAIKRMLTGMSPAPP